MKKPQYLMLVAVCLCVMLSIGFILWQANRPLPEITSRAAQTGNPSYSQLQMMQRSFDYDNGTWQAEISSRSVPTPQTGNASYSERQMMQRSFDWTNGTWQIDVDETSMQDALGDNLNALATPTPNAVPYANNSSVITFLPLGASGTVLTSNGATSAPTFETPSAAGDVESVGDCTDGACLDGSSDGGSYVRIYDGDSNYLEFNPGNLSTNRTITTRDAAGTLILSGDTFTGDVTGTLDTDGSTALTLVKDVIEGFHNVTTFQLEQTSSEQTDFVQFSNISSVALFTVDAVNDKIILPQLNTASHPTLSFGDGDSGFYESSDDNIGFSIAGTLQYLLSGTSFAGFGGTEPGFLLEGATLTNPTLVPSKGDTDTGIGGDNANGVSLVAGGVGGFKLYTTYANFSVPPQLPFQTADPCGTYPEGVIWYNSTADVMCYCNGAGADLKVADDSACF